MLVAICRRKLFQKSAIIINNRKAMSVSSSVNSKSPLQSSSCSEESFSYHHGLSSSCSSISSNTSTISNDSINFGSSLSDQQLAIHLMFYNSIEMISRRFINAGIYYKITSFVMNSSNETITDDVPVNDEDAKGFREEYPFEISVMSDIEHKFQRQNEFGRLLKNNEFVLLRTKIPMTETIGLRVDLFQKAADNFNKLGFCYVYPLETKESNGICNVPITSKIGKIVAKFKAEYFVAKPYEGITREKSTKLKSKTPNLKSWQLKKDGYDIGHRGAGCARRIDSNEQVLENTVDSFNFAFKKGADMVELDVQLSKDKVPIVYHDFNVNIVLQKKDQLDQEQETFEMNIKDLTYNQLQKLKIKPIKECYDFEDGNNKPDGKPFASLKTVLQSVDSNCGFNVEIKYPQRKINGDWESEKSHDLNEYVDLILQDLFLYGEERNIIISSFHPEICSLAKIKQNRYPVLFLTQGLTTKWMKYENPLNHSIEMATYLALSMELYGIAVHAEDIIKDTSLIRFVKSKSLVLFCWGDDLNDRQLIQNLKKEGIDGAIYDKIDLLITTEKQTERRTNELEKNK